MRTILSNKGRIYNADNLLLRHPNRSAITIGLCHDLCAVTNAEAIPTYFYGRRHLTGAKFVISTSWGGIFIIGLYGVRIGTGVAGNGNIAANLDGRIGSSGAFRTKLRSVTSHSEVTTDLNSGFILAAGSIDGNMSAAGDGEVCGILSVIGYPDGTDGKGTGAGDGEVLIFSLDCGKGAISYEGTIQYRVCAYDSQGATSDYQTSASRTVINNQAPVISGSDGNLGTKTAGFSQTYTVSDADGDSITVEETIDNKTIRSYVVTLGATNTFSVTGETWLEQSNGSHTMKIKATDSFGNSTTRTYTFTKSVSGFTIQNTEPYSSDTRPTRIKITVTRNIPAESTFKVYVCNNGFDASPTWEDATTSVTGGLVHVFENTTKTGAAWGVIIKVVVTRGEGEGACYVSQIGGNFE